MVQVCMPHYFAQTSMTLEFRMTMGPLYYNYREIGTFSVDLQSRVGLLLTSGLHSADETVSTDGLRGYLFCN